MLTTVNASMTPKRVVSNDKLIGRKTSPFVLSVCLLSVQEQAALARILSSIDLDWKDFAMALVASGSELCTANAFLSPCLPIDVIPLWY